MTRASETDLEQWRFWAKPSLEGPWALVQRNLEGRGWYVRVWKGVTIPPTAKVMVWSLPPLVGVLMLRDTGERVGLLYGEKPSYLP